MIRVIKLIGSLRFAIFLIVSLTVLLSVSTFVESAHGTPFAQRLIYEADWFDIFLGLVWLNIFCATLTRWPYKKHHTGFIITHIGLLTLLIGALLSRTLGVEGQMALFENEQRNKILQPGYHLLLVTEDKKAFQVSLKDPHYKNSYDTGPLTIYRVYENAIENLNVAEDAAAAENHAIQLRLSSELTGLNETFWLVENDPDNPHAYFKNIGPAHIELKVNGDGVGTLREAPLLRITQKSTGKTFTVDVGAPFMAPILVGDLTVTDLHYFPSAKVDGEKIVNTPEEIHFNPAVEFEIRDSKGRIEHHTKFFLFPDFASLRGGEKNNVLDLAVALDVPVPDELKPPQPGLVFHVSENSGWTYEIRSSKNPVGVRLAVPSHQPIQTGWMDIQAEILQILNRARLTQEISQSPVKNAGRVAIEISAQTSPKQWIFLDSPAWIQTPGGTLQVALKQNNVRVPFVLQLKDFRKVDYPGTASPASFESDVLLYDHEKNIGIQKTISMNNPLDYAGFRIFQSSYMQDETYGEGSVFTIAKNPGISLIYSGAVVLFLGIILLFFIKPFSREGLLNEN